MLMSEISKSLSTQMGIDPHDARKIVKFFFGQIEKALKSDERVEIRGFGTFTVKNYKGYKGRNPKTGETVEVAPKKLPRFKTGLRFYKLLNERG